MIAMVKLTTGSVSKWATGSVFKLNAIQHTASGPVFKLELRNTCDSL
jgi:hypothetical protein